MSRCKMSLHDYLVQESAKYDWKEAKDLERKNKLIFGITRKQWQELKWIILRSGDIAANANTLDDAAQRIKRDARICESTWITIDHIKVALVMAL